MDYAAAASHAAAAPPAADPQHPHYPHPPGYPYPYAAYHQTDPAAEPSASADPQHPHYPHPPGYPYPYAYHQADPAADPSASGDGAADPQHPHYPHPPGYPYPYAYHQADPAADPSASAASSSYYYSNPTARADAGVPYNPYGPYQYYGAPAMARGGGLVAYYFSAGESSQAPAVSAAQAAPATTGRDAGKHFGFDPQRYAQVAAMKAPKGMAPVDAATGMHHVQWNVHFGHPLPKNFLRKHIKKTPKVVQPATCEVCKIQCDTLDVLRIHKTGKKHKKNLEKLQDSITPKPAKPPNNAVGANTTPAAVADGAVPALQPKKNKSSSATREDLEVKKRRVLEAGAAQDEVKICTACNVVVNSEKVYEFHIAGQKHKANLQKQQQVQLHHIA